jgi:hypothetical protein
MRLDVRRLFGLGINPLGEKIVVQQRRTIRHRIFDIDDMRQNLVLDLDQFERFGSDRR